MKLKVAAIQLSAARGAREANIQKAMMRIRDAAAQGARLCVLPELALDVFFPQWKDDAFFSSAEPADGPLVQAFQALAKELAIGIALPFFEKSETGVYYNTVALLDSQGNVAGLYRKNHIPFTKSYEKYYFTPGSGFPVFDTEFGKVGICVCYDRRYPETCRELIKQGARIILIPISSSVIDGFSEKPMWECELRTRALENQCCIVACNRTGTEADYQFFGWSLILGPGGNVIARADDTEDLVLTGEIDTDEVDQLRYRSPLLRDRRPELYTT